MADLMKEIARADRAKAILEDPVVIEAFEAIERQLIEALIQTSGEDEKRREKLHLMLVYGRNWKRHLIGMIETGKLAAFQLAEQRKPKLWGLR